MISLDTVIQHYMDTKSYLAGSKFNRKANNKPMSL